MITIKKMAEMLGTSTTTVSNVIHGKTGEVSPAMIEKVQRLIEEYDYVPNINARNLANNKSGIIGLAIKNSSVKYENYVKDPFAGELIGAIESCVRGNGYFTMLLVSDNIAEITSSVASWNVDGIVLLGMQTEDMVFIKSKIKKPMVFIDCYFNNELYDYLNIGTADRQGAYEITKYVISKGHKRIAYIADNCAGVDYERFLGYKEAVLEAGIAYDDNDFIMITHKGARLSASLEELYNRSEDYTAFVCASDYYAANIMNYLMDRGKKIPDDISVTGFDDNAYSKTVRPALSTVRQDVSEKGRLAVEKLFEIIAGERHKEKQISMPVQLIIRDSVKNIN